MKMWKILVRKMNYGHCWIIVKFYGLDDVNNTLFAIIFALSHSPSLIPPLPFFISFFRSFIHSSTQFKTPLLSDAGRWNIYYMCSRFLPAANNDSLKSCTQNCAYHTRTYTYILPNLL